MSASKSVAVMREIPLLHFVDDTMESLDFVGLAWNRIVDLGVVVADELLLGHFLNNCCPLWSVG